MSNELDQQAFHLMRRLFQSHTAEWQKTLPELTKPQYAVLKAVLDHPGIEQVELMDVAISSKATLAEMLNRMEKRGLIVRQPDPNDKRRRHVYLTQQGVALIEESIPVAEAVDKYFLQKISALDQINFIRTISAMINE